MMFGKLSKFIKSFLTEREGSLTDALSYDEVVNGVMHTHNGHYLVGFEVHFDSTSYQGDYEIIINRLHYMLSRLLPEPCRFRLVYFSERLDESYITAYEQRITATEPEGRRFLLERAKTLRDAWTRGELLQWRAFVILRLGGPGSSETKALREARALSLRDQVMRQYKAVGFKTVAMDDDAVRDLCHDYLNPDLKGMNLGKYVPNPHFFSTKHVKKHPEAAAPTFRSQVGKSTVDNSDLDQITVGATYCRALTLHTIPTPHSEEAMIHALDNAGSGFCAVIDVYAEPKEKIYANIVRKNGWYLNASQSPLYVDQETLSLLKSSTEALRVVNDEDQKFVQVSMAIFLFGNDEQRLQEKQRAVYRALSDIPGNPFMPLQDGVAEAFFAFAPFSGLEHDQKVIMTSGNATHFMPVTGPWAGNAKQGKFVTALRNNYFGLTLLDFFKRGSSYNGIITGESRSGKSFGAAYALSEFLADKNHSAAIIDVGLGYRYLVEMFHGSYKDTAKECWNPFALPPGSTLPTEEDEKDTLGVLLTMAPPSPGADGDIEQTMIRSALKDVYRYKAKMRGGELPTLSEFVARLRTTDEINGVRLSVHQLSLREGLVTRFGLWAGDTPYGRLFDGQSSPDLFTTRLVYFDISGFLKDARLAPVGITAVANFVKKYMMRDTRPTVLVADELAETMKTSPMMRAFIETLYATAAKHIAGVWGLSQNLDQFSDAMFNNANFHLGFPSKISERRTWLARWSLPESVIGLAKQAHKVNGEYSQALCFMRDGDGVVGDIVTIYPNKYDLRVLDSEKDRVAQLRQAAERTGDVFAAIDELEAA